MQEYNLTEKEKSLLNYAYTDTDRINKGILFDYQVVSLKIIRKCQEYLDKKYPGFNLEMITFTPQTKIKKYTEIHFITNDLEAHFVLHYEINDGKEIFKDNFYDVPYIKAYDKLIEELLKENGIIARCFTIFPYLLEEKINNEKELLNEKKYIGRNTEIFISVLDLPTPSDSDTLTDKIEKVFRDEGIYMNGMVYFILDLKMDNEPVYYDSYIKERRNQKNMIINSFRTRF